MEHFKLGAIPDPRSDEAKNLDWHHAELYATMPVTWIEKPQTSWKKYTLRNQDGSGSCVSQGSAKALEVQRNEVESAHPIYARRPNIPDEGMYLQAAGDILKNKGTTLETLDHSENLSEALMNLLVTVDTPTTIGGYAFLPIDIDSVAQGIDLHGAVPMTFSLSWAEWSKTPGVPVYDATAHIDGGHCICAIDYFLYNGQKALLCENSWGNDPYSLDHSSQLIITEGYLNARCTGAMYFIPKVIPPTPVKPQHTFNQDLRFGMLNNTEVMALQDCLRYDGEFPMATHSTGNFLQTTFASVVKFQKKHGVASTGFCGPITRGKLNSIFS